MLKPRALGLGSHTLEKTLVERKGLPEVNKVVVARVLYVEQQDQRPRADACVGRARPTQSVERAEPSSLIVPRKKTLRGVNDGPQFRALHGGGGQASGNTNDAQTEQETVRKVQTRWTTPEERAQLVGESEPLGSLLVAEALSGGLALKGCSVKRGELLRHQMWTG